MRDVSQDAPHSLPRGRLLLAGLVVAGAATLAPLVGRLRVPLAGAVAGPAVPLPLDGTWHTVANGDRVNRVLKDGNVVWSATEAGGLVRWDLTSGAARQYLAPQDGLPSNDVNALLKAADGALWLGTEGGLVRLEPETSEVVVLTPATSTGMPALPVRALAWDVDGVKLWVGFGQRWDPAFINPETRAPGMFRAGGLARFDPIGGTWDEEIHAEPETTSPIGGETGERYATIPSENITDIAVGTDGILWVGSQPFYVFERYGCPPADPSCRPEGNWVLAGGGLAAREGAKWMNWLPSQTSLSCFSNHITDLEPDVEGRMWAGTAGRGLLLMNEGLKRVGCRGGQPYWVKTVSSRPGPRGNYVWSVDVDSGGRVWIGHGSGRDDALGVGILRHQDSFDTTLDDSWEFLNLDDGPEETRAAVTALDVSDPALAILGTKDWFNGDGWGLRSYDTAARRWRPFRTADSGLPSNRIQDVAWNAAKDEVWFAFAKRGVARLDGSGWRWWRTFGRGQQVTQAAEAVAAGFGRVPVDLADQAAFDAAFPDAARYLRFGDDPTLYRLTRGNLVLVGGKNYLDFTPKLKQAVAAGTPVYNVDRGPASDTATDLAFGADGTVWVGGATTIWMGSNCPAEWGVNCWQDGGLGRFDGQRWEAYDEHVKDANGNTMPDQAVQAVAVDPAGRVWVGTGDIRTATGAGIGVLDPATNTWSKHPADRNVRFGGMGVSDLSVDATTGDVWAVHHAAQDCVPITGGGCRWLRYGGGVSRWNGSSWQVWQKPAASLLAFGTEGELSVVQVDRGLGRVWAGGWNGEEPTFHWGLGIGIDAVVNWCPLDCGDDDWRSQTWPGQGEVVAMALDDDGQLWLGMHRSGNGIIPPDAGIRVFDGQGWQAYTPANSGLPSNEITGLARQGDQMWVTTLSRGASRYTRYVPPTPTPTPTQTLEPTPTGPSSATPTATATATSSGTPGEGTPTPRTSTPTASGTASPTATGDGPRRGQVFLPFAFQPTRGRR